MAEEHRIQIQGLCVNNCGFFGSPTTQNLCSKCYRDAQLKEQQSSTAKQAETSSLSPPARDCQTKEATIAESQVAASPSLPQPFPPLQQQPGRCYCCKKRVQLTGFKCKCGSVFCGTHRYPDQHQCTFDFKKMGKDQIAKANPVVIAKKLDKI